MKFMDDIVLPEKDIILSYYMSGVLLHDINYFILTLIQCISDHMAGPLNIIYA